MKYLLIAEKPSLMAEIRRCYEKHEEKIIQAVGEIEFTALAGHVCRLAEPDEYPEWKGVKWEDVGYPMVPHKWKVLPAKDAHRRELLESLGGKAASAGGIIVATDSDAEGYGIYRLVEECLGLGNRTALRFVEHSLTDKEILASLLSMTDIHADPIHASMTQSYLVRSRADWLFGMNASRIMSVRCGETMRVGRVKSPTIKLVYDNCAAIENFVPETYYVVIADYGAFKSTLVDDKEKKEIRLRSADDAEAYPLDGTVEEVKKRRITTHAPKLFDLTTAQAEAGRLYGFTPSHTLDIIQSLYERHKAVSYPRTQCKYVSSEKAKEFRDLLTPLAAFPDLAAALTGVADKDIKRVQKDRDVVNDKEVEKESHDALLPTGEIPDLAQMADDEQKICRMIYARFLAQFLPAAQDDRTDLYIRHGSGLFHAEGKTVAEQGWRVLFKEAKDAVLPPLNEGDGIKADRISPARRETKPPKRFTQYSLIHAMENIADLIEDRELKKTLADSKGIGTSATRAAIIDEIIGSGYMEDRHGGLYMTDAGKRYVEALSGFDIIRPEFAAVMDLGIKSVQRREAEADAVYADVLEKLDAMCRGMLKAAPPPSASLPEGTACPMCGSPVSISRYSYECSAGCGFKVAKNACGREITPAMLSDMLSGVVLGPYHLKSRAGKKFMARLYIADGKLGFDFNGGAMTCPACGQDTLRLTEKGLFCDCGFKAFRDTYGTRLTDAQLTRLAEGRETGEIRSFKSKKTGKSYAGILYLDEDNAVKLRFPDRTGAAVSDAADKAGTRYTDIPCPACGEENIAINRSGAFCECGFKLFRKEYGAVLDDDELGALLKDRETGLIDRFVSKKTGASYSGSLYLGSDNTVQIRFEDRYEAAPSRPGGILCPSCRDRDVAINRGGAFCECGFKLYRREFGRELSDGELEELLTDRETGVLDGFESKKTGKSYSAILFLDEENAVRIRFPERGPDGGDSGILCPSCGERNVVINRGGAFCECGLKLFRKQFGKELTDEELSGLLTRRETDVIDGFVSKKTGEEYSAALYADDDGRIRLRFDSG